MKSGEFIIVLILLIGLGAAIYFLYLNFPGKPIELELAEQTKPKTPQKTYNSSVQFYQRMRFSERLITYGFDPVCDEKRKSQVELAFRQIEEKTVLGFQNSQTPQIEITCSELVPEPENKGHFIAGEGGPTEIINNTLYSVILKGKISLYRNEKCSSPKIATHEILHVLGFDHNNNPSSILYPTLDCKQETDQYIIDELNSLYQAESAPDFVIQGVSGNLAGKYLSFEIEVLNQGLKDADGVILAVYGDGDFIQNFVLGSISVGTKKILAVENARATRTTKTITFIVDQNNIIREIDENNNKKELIIP